MSERTCSYRHCTVSLEGRRRQCDYCKPAHRTAESRLRRADALEQATQTERAVSRPLRRANREGVGTRLYVTAEEIEFLSTLPRQNKYRGDLLAGRLMLKLDRAAERVRGEECA